MARRLQDDEVAGRVEALCEGGQLRLGVGDAAEPGRSRVEDIDRFLADVAADEIVVSSWSLLLCARSAPTASCNCSG